MFIEMLSVYLSFYNDVLCHLKSLFYSHF
jgi:hypothetical protein